jgi:hypothetical protein
MDKLSEVTLTTLAGGGAVELFEREFKKVLANILDPNTNAAEKRSVTIECVIEPHESRESGAIAVKVKSKLAGPKPLASLVHFGEHNGRPVAVGFDPRQHDAFHTEADASVRPITHARSAQ